MSQNDATQQRFKVTVQKGKNCFVNPTERKKKEDAAESALTTWAAANRESKEDEDLAADPKDNEEDDEDEDGDNEGDVGEWFRAIAQMAPGDAFYESDDDSNLVETTTRRTERDDSDDVDYYNQDTPPEYCCEENWSQVPPLPNENVSSYPQEDTRFFSSKTEPKYVRNDKVSLDAIILVVRCMPTTSLPPLRSVYQDKVRVDTQGW